jgi:hypothetical protein
VGRAFVAALATVGWAVPAVVVVVRGRGRDDNGRLGQCVPAFSTRSGPVSTGRAHFVAVAGVEQTIAARVETTRVGRHWQMARGVARSQSGNPRRVDCAAVASELGPTKNGRMYTCPFLFSHFSRRYVDGYPACVVQED